MRTEWRLMGWLTELVMVLRSKNLYMIEGLGYDMMLGWYNRQGWEALWVIQGGPWKPLRSLVGEVGVEGGGVT